MKPWTAILVPGDAEQFIPHRYDGKIGDVYRSEGLAQHVQSIFAVGKGRTGLTVSCLTQGGFVLINDARAPYGTPPLVRISLDRLARLALREEEGLRFSPGDCLFLDRPWVIPVEALSAEGSGLACLPDPLVPSANKYILAHESPRGQVRRLLAPSWGMDAPEQAQALIGRIAPLHDWTRPPQALLDGLSSQESGALGERVRQECRTVGGNEHWKAGRRRAPAPARATPPTVFPRRRRSAPGVAKP